MAHITSSALDSILNSPPPPSNATEIQATLVAGSQCTLGECVIYDDHNDQVLWIDIFGKKFYKLPLSPSSSREVQSFDLPKILCAFSLRPPGNKGYLCAWEDGFQLYDIENGVVLSNESKGEDVNPMKGPTRLNDGRCDGEGRRFICGGCNGDTEGISGMNVFKCEFIPGREETGRCLVHEKMDGIDLPDIEVSNGISFSPDGETMYFADSPKQNIYKYKYDKETGELTDKAVLIKLDVGVPDGSCVDEEGYVWNAVWMGGTGPGRVIRIHPTTGNVVFTVNVPDFTSQTSCCCFGGKNMDVLFITSARWNRDLVKEPNAGGLYAVKVGFKGRKESRFTMK